MKITGTGASTTCNQCNESSTFTIFNGRIGVCDFKKNSTHVPETRIDKCELYNDDTTLTCKKCTSGYVWSDDSTKCIHET